MLARMDDTSKTFRSLPRGKTGLTRLTQRQELVVRFLVENPRASIGEILKFIGATSTNAAASHLRALARRGWLRMAEKNARSIELLPFPVQPDAFPLEIRNCPCCCGNLSKQAKRHLFFCSRCHRYMVIEERP